MVSHFMQTKYQLKKKATLKFPFKTIFFEKSLSVYMCVCICHVLSLSLKKLLKQKIVPNKVVKYTSRVTKLHYGSRQGKEKL